jgi:phosphate starvation-inducible PhoH-like protein
MSRGRKKKYTPEDQDDILQDIEKSHETNVLNSINVKLKAKTENQKKLMNSMKNNTITICSGSPGSGKTYVTCAAALEILKNDPKIKKIVIAKSVTVLQDEEVGFLKGTLKEKMEPVMYSFTGNFEKIIGLQKLELLKLNGYIQELPIAYIRGITIDNALIIVDETQNITKKNVKTIMTRLGENSKLIFLGDLEQVDMKKPELSALKHILKIFTDEPEFGTIELTDDDIVRHPLIKVILKKFRENE